MAEVGKKLYLGNEPITLIQNNGFVYADPFDDTVPPPPNPVTSGRILELNVTSPSYPGSGDVWYDVSGNGYNFAMTGSATFSTSDGWDLNGSTDYLWLDSTSGLNGQLSGTIDNGITVFVDHYKDLTTGEGTLVASWLDAGALYKFLLEANNSRTIESAVRLSTNTVRGGDSTGTIATQTREITGFRVQSGVQTRFNNNADLTGTITTTGTWGSNNPPTTIGGRFNSSSVLTNPYNGKIKAVLIYNRALSSTERTDVYDYLLSL